MLVYGQRQHGSLEEQGDQWAGGLAETYSWSGKQESSSVSDAESSVASTFGLLDVQAEMIFGVLPL